MDIVEQVLEIIEESSQRCARERFAEKRQLAAKQRADLQRQGEQGKETEPQQPQISK